MDVTPHSQYTHFHPITVRWGEMDALGHVNNTVFYRYSEDGRLDYFRKMLDAAPEADGSGPILADLRCSFLQQLHFPADIEIATRVANIGGSSMRMEQALFHQGGTDPVATYQAIVVWFDYKGQGSAPVPEAMRQRVREMESVPPAE